MSRKVHMQMDVRCIRSLDPHAPWPACGRGGIRAIICFHWAVVTCAACLKYREKQKAMGQR